MLQGSMTMSLCSLEGTLWLSLPLSFLASFYANTKKKKSQLLLLVSHTLLFLVFFSSLSFCLILLHFPPSSRLHQVSPCQSVVATFRSGTSPRETVGLTMWRSASAGDAVCLALMSSWRYREET